MYHLLEFCNAYENFPSPYLLWAKKIMKNLIVSPIYKFLKWNCWKFWSWEMKYHHSSVVESKSFHHSWLGFASSLVMKWFWFNSRLVMIFHFSTSEFSAIVHFFGFFSLLQSSSHISPASPFFEKDFWKCLPN